MICRNDGYSMRETFAFGAAPRWTCTNPWHPHHPGPCPQCGNTGNHHVAGMGVAGALCSRCTHWWLPDVPLSVADGLTTLPPVLGTEAVSG
jgi:hypothetical protein